MQTEIEIKCLLGSQEAADAFIHHLEEFGIQTSHNIIPERQLNHYFSGGTILDIYTKLSDQMSFEKQEALHNICLHGNNHIIKTLNVFPGDHSYLIIKVTTHQDASDYSVSKRDFECLFPGMTINELDSILIDLGREYISKWSRIRTNYTVDDINIILDQCSGYGYIVTFETTAQHGESAKDTEHRLRTLMDKLDIHEITQDKLEQILNHYDEHWSDYFGTHQSFTVSPDGEIIRYGFEDSPHTQSESTL